MSSPGVHKPGTDAPAPPPYTPNPEPHHESQPAYPPGYGPYNGPPPAPPVYGFVPNPNQPNYGNPPAPGYGATVITVQPTPEIVVLNGCPACRSGVLQDEFTCLGIFCAIFFFPLGILCCLLTRERRCTNCRTEY